MRAAIAVAAAGLAACASATPPAPPAPEPFRSPRLLEDVAGLSGAEQELQARNFLSLLARERGRRDRPPPPEIAALAPRLAEVVGAAEFRAGLTPPLLVALGMIGGGRAEAVLTERARSSREEEELSAIAAALGELATPGAVTALAGLGRGSRSRIRRDAAVALAHTGREEAVPILTRMLEDPDLRVRGAAAVALAAAFRNESGRPILKTLLDRTAVEAAIPAEEPKRAERVDRTMASGAGALAAIRDRSVIEVLQVTSMDDPSPVVRMACRDALAILFGKD